MKKVMIKIVAVLAAGITAGGVIAGVKDLKQQKKSEHKPYGTYEKYMKRPLDYMISACALIMLSPVMLVTALLVRVKLGAPVIFRQERPGKDEKIFTLYKFRTMTDKRDAEGNLLPDEERLTKFGSFLRSTSLDELPELLNIFKGEMAVVGPRPLLVEYLPRYNDRQKHRHDVRPGLTGLAQVSGRNAISWEEKFEDDVEYVRKIKFLDDVKIIRDTIATVLKREGISSESGVTMEIFRGNVELRKIPDIKA